MVNGRGILVPRRIVPPVELYVERFSTVVAATTQTLLLPADRRRVSFIIGAAASVNTIIWPGGIRASGKGIKVAEQSGYFHFKWCDHPALIVLPWYCIDSVGNVTLEIAESLCVP